MTMEAVNVGMHVVVQVGIRYGSLVGHGAEVDRLAVRGKEDAQR